MLLAQAQEAGVILDEEQLAFLADTVEGTNSGPDTHILLPTAIFQTNDLDAFNADCDEAPSASAVLMANILVYESEVLSKENKSEVVQDTTSSEQQNAMIMSVIEEMSSQVAKCNADNQENKIVNESLTAELERYKEHVNFFLKRQNFELTDREKHTDSQMRAQRIQSALYRSHTLVKKHDALSVIDTEETLKLAEKSKLKMNAKQNDLIVKEKKLNITSIDYAALNKLSEHFVAHFVPKKQLSAEQAFWLPISKIVYEQPPVQPKPVQNDIPRELPSINRKYFEIEKKDLLIENDRLLEHLIFQDIMCIAMHADLENKYVLPTNNDNLEYADMEKSFIDEYRMYKLDLHPLSPKLRKNREAHVDYLNKTKEHAECALLEQARALKPLDNVSQNENEKLVAVTPMNKSKKVRFAEPRVNNSINASRSKPKGNTRNNKITRTSSRNQMNKQVEDHPRNVKSSLNKKNRISVCNDNIKHGVLMRILNLANYGKSNKKNEWTPTGKVFTKVGNRWLPARRTFTIDGTKYPLTRITSTKVVPPGKPVQTKVIKKTPPSSVSQGKPNETKTMSSSSNTRIVESRHSNNSKPNQNWGPNVLNSASSSHVQRRLYKSSSDGVDLLTGSRGTNLYTLSLEDMMKSSPICLLSKASKTKSWLWHQRLSHLNFGTINELAKQGLVRDNGIEFVNQTLKTYYEDVRISHQTSVPLFSLAEAVATACYTHNRSLIRSLHNKTPYELLHDRKPDLKYFHVFGALCYPTNDSEDLGKLKPKADIGIFIGYSPAKKAYRIYNKRTRLIMETIHVKFDELTTMASE
ncbi:integrase, catalytic region, zinc finger, CCHC-type containing protein [Tanacetum coccineum]|uniref:Integrase, catalytic region, zinc finger, CCHC-type containing protein n=1 Tax=Tanacetum coccineum TaxID=301880 RepID=A0ABQ5A5J4_9ASTR